MKSFEELVGTDSLYTDDSDRKILEEMPETKREKILYERYCRLKEIEEKRQLQKMTSGGFVPQGIPETPQKKLSVEECDFIVKKKELVDKIFSPLFPLFVGSFVRVRLNDYYCVCKITGIIEKKPYPLLNRNREKTDLALVLDTGTKVVSGVGVTNVSSQGVEENELQEFVEKFKIKNVDSLRSRYRRTIRDVSRELTKEEQVRLIEINERSNPKEKSKVDQKIELILKRDKALASKDKEKAQHYQSLLEKMENEEREKRRRREEDEKIAARQRLEKEYR